MVTHMFKRIREDIAVVFQRDPAVRSRLEILLCYPGFHAVLFYRIAHAMWRRGWVVPARWLSHWGRFLTGIEIHPGARIGRRLFIDHGMGVVIGETSIIGDDVTLYHGVTLGGIAPSVNASAQVNQKRHPTLEDGVIVGSGAQVLGPVTVGNGARVGANAVAIADVAPNTTVVGIPARVSAKIGKSPVLPDFAAYGLPHGTVSDPIARILDGLLNTVHSMGSRIAELEAEAEPKPAIAPLSEPASRRRSDA